MSPAPRTLEAMLRPSSAHRWLECPGAPAAEAPYPNTSGPDARYGTAAHALAARCLVEKIDPAACMGDLIEVEGHPIRVDRDMTEGVAEYFKFLSRLPVQAREVEAEINLQTWLPNNGTADWVGYDAHTLHLVDLKFGRGVKVYADSNPQLMTYALGKYYELEALGLADLDHRIYLHIVQPRISHYDGWATTPKALLEHGARLTQGVGSALAVDAPRRAGKHCKFCQAKADCSALARFTADALGAQFDDLTQTPVKGPVDVFTPDTPADELALKLGFVETVRDWASAIEKAALAAALAGVELLGYKLVAGRTSRAWLDRAAAEQWARKKRLAVDVFMPRDFATAPALEKTLGKEKFSKLGFPLLITKPEGAPTLAPVNDKRPAIKITPLIEQFEDLTTEDLLS